MIKKRLLGIVPEAGKFIGLNVLFQWIGLCSNVVMVHTIAKLLDSFMLHSEVNYGSCVSLILGMAAIRIVCVKLAHLASFHASKNVKITLRELLYRKMLRLGPAYTEYAATAEAVQLSGEGVEQLETYFGQYMPQFFYAFLAPITLFFVIRPISSQVATVLLICVPLIPAAIVVVQKIAKRLLKNYWGQYAKLGDHFLENLQGLTTLKIYQADEERHQEMKEDAELFRRITMKVLSMQLNSIIVMDVVAYGGAAMGILLAIQGFVQGEISCFGCFIIILLSAEFFLPMRQLGSFFHVAMNGMTASDRIFAILDIPEEELADEHPVNSDILLDQVRFGYSAEKETLHDIRMEFPEGSFSAIVGESGCGKSTIAGLLGGRNRGYSGSIRFGNAELFHISQNELMEKITLISHNSYIFKGTLRDNLLMGKPDSGEEELWSVLEQVNLADYARSEGGLDCSLSEGGSNLSGGQRQRLALARAILHDSPVYLFDEATSNIDSESENDLMKLILGMTEKTENQKTVILISHRLSNVVKADRIYVMKDGEVVQSGSHPQLLEEDNVYRRLWNEQQMLEKLLGKEA